MLEGKGLARTSWKAYVGKTLYSTLNQSRKPAQDSWPGHAWVYEAGEGMESGTRAFFAGALRKGPGGSGRKTRGQPGMAVPRTGKSKLESGDRNGK